MTIVLLHFTLSTILRMLASALLFSCFPNLFWSCIREDYQWEQIQKQISFAWGVSLALVLDVVKVLKSDSKFLLSPCVKNKNRRGQFRASDTFEENASFKVLQRGREPENMAASFLISALNQTKDLFVWNTDKLLDQLANRLLEISHKMLVCKLVGSNNSSRHNIYKFHRKTIYRGMSKEFIFSHENWTSLQRGVSFEAWTR